MRYSQTRLFVFSKYPHFQTRGFVTTVKDYYNVLIDGVLIYLLWNPNTCQHVKTIQEMKNAFDEIHSKLNKNFKKIAKMFWWYF